MAKSTRGFCKYCGKEYTRTEKYFELLLYGAYNKDYWLIIQIKENATLDDLD